MSIQDSDFLLAAGGKSWSPEAVGDEIEGTLVSAKKQQANDIDGKPKTWDNGDPVYVYVITLQTALRDPENPTDEGLRTVWAKGGSTATDKGTTMLVAIRTAVQASGGEWAEGGTLKVRHTDTKKTGYPQPARLYKAKWTPPAAGPSVEDF